jgi:hypothetical protein
MPSLTKFSQENATKNNQNATDCGFYHAKYQNLGLPIEIASGAA